MKKIGELKSFIGGISTASKKNGPPNSFAWGRSIDFRSDTAQFSIQPKSVKLASSIITDLPMAADIVNTDLFFYGNTGRVYKVDTNDSVSFLHTMPNSQGNGMAYFPEDKRLYLAGNNSIGYYSSQLPPFSISEKWTSNSISSTWYDWSIGQATVTNGQLTLTTTTAGNFFGVELATVQDLTSYIATNQLVSVGSRSLASYEVYPLYIKIQGDSTNQLFWFIDASNHLRAYKKVAGSNTIVNFGTYDAAVHKFFRIYEDTGIIHYDYSTDGNNWIPFASTSNPFAITKVIIGTQIGSTAEVATTSAVFDNFSFTPFSTTAQFTANFLETEGGAPTNTNSLKLIAASSQSATHIDDASLSVTGDLTLEAFVNMTSLPTGANKMSIISKWDESGALRSYKLDIVPTSSSFGSGSDGSITISASATETVIDANCSGSSGQNILLLSNITGTFAVGQKVYIHQSRGAGHGRKQITTILAVNGSALTLADNLNFNVQHSAVATDANKAQIRVIKQYTDGTINIGVTLTCKAWDGFKGGLGFVDDFSGTLTINGSILGTGKGFLGGVTAGFFQGYTGEAADGPSLGPPANQSFNAYTLYNTGDSRAGGGSTDANSSFSAPAGGGNRTQGGNGTTTGNSSPPQHTAIGGLAVSSSDLSLIDLGSGGGSGDLISGGGTNTGGTGGCIIEIYAAHLTGSGSIIANGSAPTLSASGSHSGPAGAAGGSISLHVQTADLTNMTIQAVKSTGINGVGNGAGAKGGDGSDGIVAVGFYSSVTGSTSPAFNAIQDDTLGLASGSALQLSISNDGTTVETYTQNIDNPLGLFRRISVTWQAAISTASFYQNAALLGTRTGSMTAIKDNATEFAVGCSKNGSGTRANFFDGLLDDVRIFNTVKTPVELSIYNSRVLTGLEAGLVAYYKFDGNLTDSQSSGLNTLTGNNTPTYSSDVAFKGITTRNDEDVFLDKAGQTYTLGTSLSESATNKLSFVPTKEPLKSIALNINNIGTGDWTVVIHDVLNNVVASVTVKHANLQTGIFEFILSSVARPVLNASYHLHVYDTTGDGVVVTGTNADLSTAYLKTFFQILVDDQYHPMEQFINFLVIGNERYVATLEAGNIYTPHRLILPSGYRVRSLAFWQEYIVIGTWKGTDVTDTDSGRIFFWDGTSETYIDSLDIPQGAINAMFGTQGGLLIAAGYKGTILEYTGYPSSYRYTARTKAQLAFRLPNIQEEDTVEIAPNAITMWNGMNRIGVALNTNSTTLHEGNYTYGQYTDQDPVSVGFDYPLSIGDQQSAGVKVGCLTTRGTKLYTGFQNGNTFGIDVVDAEAGPADTATIELLITDLGAIAPQKMPLIFRADNVPLVDGQSLALKYKPDRASDWIPLTTQDNAGAMDIRGIINQRVKEAQFAMDIVTAGQQVILTGFTFESEGEESSIRA